MDFHRAFREIDTDNSGEITRSELEAYMHQNNYKPAFVDKWLRLFDIDGDGQITYDEYCTTLGLTPIQREEGMSKQNSTVEEVIIQSKETTAVKATPASTSKTVNQAKVNVTVSHKQHQDEDSKRFGISLHSRSDAFRRKTIYKYAVKTGEMEVNKQETKKDKGRRPKKFNQQEPKRKKALRDTKCFSDHKRRLRSSITPGTILILLSGRHRGKRVVFLKQLSSGLLLVTGPFKLNGVPLRRVHQKMVIATETKLSLGELNVPEHLNDDYFRRITSAMKKQVSNFSNELLVSNSSSSDKLYKLTEERKQDQKTIDGQVLQSIPSDPERSTWLKGYLASKFGLFKHDFPHRMKF